MLAVETEITRLLSPETVRVGLPGTTKDEILDELLELIASQPGVVDLALTRSDVLERESIMSTGVGQGLGLPHAKTNGVTQTIAAFAVSKSPVDFNAIDGKPVQLFFLLLGPESARSQHIKILSRISRLMNQTSIRQELLEAADAAQVMEVLAEGEIQLLDR